jgi:tetratricopeptide (TPR) repeat protein
VADTLENLGEIAYEEGNVADAAQLYGDSLQIHRDLGDRFSVAYSLENIAAVAATIGASDAAARLYGAAAALREDVGAPVPQSEMPRYERGLAKARAGLSASMFEAAWAAGRALSWMQAIDEAVEITQGLAAAALTSE